MWCSASQHRHPPASRAAPVGFTLLEVVLALALLFGSLAILSQLTWNGSRAALQGQLVTQAVLRCQTLIAEIQAGSVPLQNTSKTAFADDARWQYSLQISDTSLPDLLSVEATVSYAPAQGTLGNVSFTLRTWMRDPVIFETSTSTAQQQPANLHADLLARQ